LRELVGAILQSCHGGSGSDLLSLVVSSGVGIVMYARMSRQLIGPAESFATSWELAGMRLLSGVRSNVSRLMF